MTKILSFAFMIVMLVVVALAAALLQPEWAKDLGLGTALNTEFFNRPANPDLPELEARRRAKNRVVTDLIAGRLTLFEAAVLFRHWNMPGLKLENNYRGDSEEERLCRQVIAWVPVHHPPAGFLAHLEDDLRRHKEQHGTVILPDAVPQNLDPLEKRSDD